MKGVIIMNDETARLLRWRELPWRISRSHSSDFWEGWGQNEKSVMVAGEIEDTKGN